MCVARDRAMKTVRTSRTSLMSLMSRAVLSAGWLWGAAGCGNDPLPQAQRPTIEEAIQSGRGSFTRVEGVDGSAAAGELIEASPDALRLSTGDGLKTVPRARVSWARVIVYRTTEDAFAVWTVLGTLSTISHGAFLIFTAPAWVIDGIVSSWSETRRGELQYPKAAAWEDLRFYARFPQGIPGGITDGQILHGRGWQPAVPVPAPAQAPASVRAPAPSVPDPVSASRSTEGNTGSP